MSLHVCVHEYVIEEKEPHVCVIMHPCVIINPSGIFPLSLLSHQSYEMHVQRSEEIQDTSIMSTVGVGEEEDLVHKKNWTDTTRLCLHLPSVWILPVRAGCLIRCHRVFGKCVTLLGQSRLYNQSFICIIGQACFCFDFYFNFNPCSSF